MEGDGKHVWNYSVKYFLLENISKYFLIFFIFNIKIQQNYFVAFSKKKIKDLKRYGTIAIPDDAIIVFRYSQGSNSSFKQIYHISIEANLFFLFFLLSS